MLKMTMTNPPKDSTGLTLDQRVEAVLSALFPKHFHSQIVMFPYRTLVEMEKVLTVSLAVD